MTHKAHSSIKGGLRGHTPPSFCIEVGPAYTGGEGLGTARSRVVGVKKSDFQLDHVEEEFGAETFVRSYWSVAYMIAHPGFAGRALFTILDFHT